MGADASKAFRLSGDIDVDTVKVTRKVKELDGTLTTVETKFKRTEKAAKATGDAAQKAGQQDDSANPRIG